MSTCSCSRRSSTSTSSSPRSRPCASISSLPIVALMTFDADGQTLAGVSAAEAAERLGELGVAAAGREPRRRPAAALAALAAMRATGSCSRRCRTSAWRASPAARVIFPHATPEYFAEFAAHARELGARDHRRLLRHDAERRSPRSAQRSRRTAQPAAPLVVRERELAVALRDGARRRPSSRGCCARASSRLGPARPAARRQRPRVDRGGRTLRGVRPGALRRHERQPARAARMSGIMASVAIERTRGIETIPHLTPRDWRRRARVAPARRARRGRPQHARHHRRPAGGGRLPGLARRLRGRRDRADAAHHRAEPRRGLQRPRRSTRRLRSSSASP